MHKGIYTTFAIQQSFILANSILQCKQKGIMFSTCPFAKKNAATDTTYILVTSRGPMAVGLTLQGFSSVEWPLRELEKL